MEVRFDRVARQRLEGRLAAEHARRPVRLRVDAAEQAEHGAPQSQRQRPAKPLLHHVQPVATVAAEALVAAVAGQRHRHVPARELADPVGRQRRTVGVRLVVEAGQRVDQVEVVALDPIDEVPRPVALGDLLRVPGLVERRVGERDRARVDRLRRQAGHRRHDRARVDAAGQEGAERHLRDHAQPDALADAREQFRLRVLGRDDRIAREARVPVLLRLGQRSVRAARRASWPAAASAPCVKIVRGSGT